MDIERYSAASALTPTSGFLEGYTHTCNPAVGCSFAPGACGAYCYAREFAERTLGRGGWGERLRVKENLPDLLEAELLRAGRRSTEHRHHVSKLKVFSSSTTDPCAPPVLELYRECLRVLGRHPIGGWVLQTRSPTVVQLLPELRALGSRVVVSFTIESDHDILGTQGRRGSPGIAARRRAFEALARARIRRHLAVAPCLPLMNVRAFAEWIVEFAPWVTVDTALQGDGRSGARTARSELPALLAGLGFDWRDESPALELFDLLRTHIGSRVAWSQAGFARLANLHEDPWDHGP